MRILYHHRIASKDGQYVHLSAIVDALRAQGHVVKVVGPDVLEDADMGHDGGWATALKKRLPQWLYECLELGYSVLAGWRLFKAIKSFQPDVIYERYNLYQPAGVIVAKAMKLPIQLEVNAPLVYERQKHHTLALPWLASRVERFTWRHADKVLPVTKVLAEFCLRAGVDEDKIDVIHNGVKQSALDETSAIIGNKQREDGVLTIGFVGFMHLTCGVEWAIQALSQLKNDRLRLVCVGNGDNIPQLKKQAEQSGVSHQVHFTGALEREQVFEMLPGFDIALQPDVTDYASPLKMFEYMLCHSVIVAPDKPNIKEILNEDCAVFFDHSAPKQEAFCDAITRAISQFPEHRDKAGRARQRLVDAPFTWDNNAKRIVDTFTQLLKRK